MRAVRPGRARGRPGRLACDDEPFASSWWREGGSPGVEHVAYELRASCSLDDAARTLEGAGVEEVATGRPARDRSRGEARQLIPARTRSDGTLTAFACAARRRPCPRPPPPARPRQLPHRPPGGADRLLHARAGHGRDRPPRRGRRLVPRRRRPPRDGVRATRPARSRASTTSRSTSSTSGQMREALDHLGRHGRWLGWGPTRHGVGGNIASYVRIVEEALLRRALLRHGALEAEHTPRVWPDDRYSSNTWGPLPPRSYFRFDARRCRREPTRREPRR